MSYQPAIMKQILNFIPVLLLEINGGIGFIWAAPMLYRFKKDNFPLTIKQISYMGSMIFYGKILGPFLVYLLIDRIGRKKFILLSSIVFTMGWGVLSVCKTVPIIMITRLIFGIFHSANLSLVPVYTAENCYPSIRGSLMASITLGDAIGKLICFVLVLYLDYYTVHMILFAYSIIATMSTFYCVESAEFLLACNRFQKAEENYYKLRSAESVKDQVYYEQLVWNSNKNLQQIAESAGYGTNHDHAFGLRNLLHIPFSNATEKNALTIVVVVMSLTYIGSAIGPLNTYSTLLISDGIDRDVVNLMSIVQGIVFIIAAIFSATLMENFGRKDILKLGFLVDLALMMTLVLLYTYNSFNPIASLSYFVYACLLGIDFTNGISIYPMINCFKGEILPQNIKMVGVPLAVSFSALIMALETSVFWPLSKLAGIEMNFLLYAVGIIGTLIYAHFYLPETKGKTLLEIEIELENRRSVWSMKQNNQYRDYNSAFPPAQFDDGVRL